MKQGNTFRLLFISLLFALLVGCAQRQKVVPASDYYICKYHNVITDKVYQAKAEDFGRAKTHAWAYCFGAPERRGCRYQSCLKIKPTNQDL